MSHPVYHFKSGALTKAVKWSEPHDEDCPGCQIEKLEARLAEPGDCRCSTCQRWKSKVGKLERRAVEAEEERDRLRVKRTEAMDAWDRLDKLLDELSMKPHRAEEIVKRWQEIR